MTKILNFYYSIILNSNHLNGFRRRVKYSQISVYKCCYSRIFSGDVLRKLLFDKDAYNQFLLSRDWVKIQNNVSWNFALCNPSSL